MVSDPSCRRHAFGMTGLTPGVRNDTGIRRAANELAPHAVVFKGAPGPVQQAAMPRTLSQANDYFTILLKLI